MDLNKHLEFFNPTRLVKDEIHIIGCGAIGSNVALQLAKLGLTNIYLWDFDTVDDHNITNQVYNQNDIGKKKIDALEEHLKQQNPEIKITKKDKYTDQLLKGYVFSCVDSVELKYKIYTTNQYNMLIKFVTDGRIALETGQVYNVDWAIQEDIDNIIDLSDFKDSDAPVKISACGTTLSVSPTVLITISNMISSFINYINKEKFPKIIYIDAFKYKTKIVY